jgi:hypothetical protein
MLLDSDSMRCSLACQLHIAIVCLLALALAQQLLHISYCCLCTLHTTVLFTAP